MLAHTASRGALDEHAYVPFLLCTSRMIQRARPKVQIPRLKVCSVSLCHTILSRGIVLSERDCQTGSQERAEQVQKHLATHALQVAGEVACSVKNPMAPLKPMGSVLTLCFANSSTGQGHLGVLTKGTRCRHSLLPP